MLLFINFYLVFSFVCEQLSLSLSRSHVSSKHGALASSAGTGHADVDQNGGVHAVGGRGAKGVGVGGEAHVRAGGGKVE